MTHDWPQPWTSKNEFSPNVSQSSEHRRYREFSFKEPKIRIEKFVKLSDPTYACNSLTNFEYKQSACNDRKRKLWTHDWPIVWTSKN